MVLESVKTEWFSKRPYIAFFLGFIYTILGFFIASIFFGEDVSIAMLFLATLFVVPSLIGLISFEEKIERKEGIKHFFRNHKKILEVYLLLFIGIFIGYLLLGYFAPNTENVFAYQVKFLESQEGLSSELIDSFFEKAIEPTPGKVLGIIQNNLFVNIICFALSLFYGAGAIFLIILNASVFSSFIVYVIRYLSQSIQDSLIILGFFSIHLIPEVLGFMLAAIAGGVLSKAILTEKFRSREFSNVTKDAFILFLLSVFLIILSAILEVYVTTSLFHTYF